MIEEKDVKLSFNWDKYENWNGKSLKPNPKIKNLSNNTIVYSREPYAQELFDIFNNSKLTFIKKDLNKGDLLPITNITNINDDGNIVIEIVGGLTFNVDLNQEKKFLNLFNYSMEDFIKSLKNNPENIKEFLDQGIYIYITQVTPSLKFSLWQGHVKKTESTFIEEIKNPTQAYTAKIIEVNKGGFFVEIQGIRAFMPGSLAAPNKIIDFQSYLGKEVVVMIEDYLDDIQSFIVSHKKYIEYVLPSAIKELNLTKKYEGEVTGASKFGIFIEFEKIFTGLLHKTKMSEQTKELFYDRKIKPGDKLEFWIDEITKDNRIILTEEDPIKKVEELNNFLLEFKDKPIPGKVLNILNYGILIGYNDIVGILLNKDIKQKNIIKNIDKGDTINVKVKEIKENNKILFELY